MTCAEETFGSAEVARAAGLKRNTLDTWLMRHYLPLPAGRGTGRARTYNLLDAVRASAMVHLTSIGVTPARAGHATTAIRRVPMPGDTLIITADPISGTSLAVGLDAGVGGPTEADIQAVGGRIVISILMAIGCGRPDATNSICSRWPSRSDAAYVILTGAPIWRKSRPASTSSMWFCTSRTQKPPSNNPLPTERRNAARVGLAGNEPSSPTIHSRGPVGTLGL